MSTLDYQRPQDRRRDAWANLRHSIFGISQSDVWREVARRVGGSFEERGFFRGNKVVAPVGGHWTATLDIYTVSTGESSQTYTRLRVPYYNPSAFRFRLYRASFFTPLGKMLGMRAIPTGDGAFDEDFVLKSRDEVRARALFAPAAIRSMVRSQPRIRLEAKGDECWFGTRFPPNVNELRFTAAGVMKDPDVVEALFPLFAAVLRRLCELGAAVPRDPGVRL